MKYSNQNFRNSPFIIHSFHSCIIVIAPPVFPWFSFIHKISVKHWKYSKIWISQISYFGLVNYTISNVTLFHSIIILWLWAVKQIYDAVTHSICKYFDIIAFWYKFNSRCCCPLYWFCRNLTPKNVFSSNTFKLHYILIYILT